MASIYRYIPLRWVVLSLLLLAGSGAAAQEYRMQDLPLFSASLNAGRRWVSLADYNAVMAPLGTDKDPVRSFYSLGFGAEFSFTPERQLRGRVEYMYHGRDALHATFDSTEGGRGWQEEISYHIQTNVRFHSINLSMLYYWDGGRFLYFAGAGLGAHFFKSDLLAQGYGSRRDTNGNTTVLTYQRHQREAEFYGEGNDFFLTGGLEFRCTKRFSLEAAMKLHWGTLELEHRGNNSSAEYFTGIQGAASGDEAPHTPADIGGMSLRLGLKFYIGVPDKEGSG